MTNISRNKAAPSGSLTPSIAILVAVTTVNPLALNLYVPSMPNVQETFAAPASQVQLTLSLGLVGTGIIQLLIGPLSDQYGRRPVLLWGTFIAVLGSIYCAMAASLDGLIIGRIVQISSGVAGLVLGRAIVRDLYKPSEAASMLGYVTMGMAMAPMVAPTIGGVLDDLWNWRAGFVFTAAFTGMVFLTAWYNLPETNHHIGQSPSVKAMLSDYGSLLRMKNFWIYTLISSFIAGSFFSFLGGAPYVSQQLFHIGPTEYGLFFALVAAGYVLGNYLSGRHAMQIGIRKMTIWGSIVTFLSCFSVVLFSLGGIENPATLFGATFFLGIGNGLVFPSASAGVVSVIPRLAGSASGLSGSIMTLMNAVFTYVVSFMLSDSLMPMALLMSASGFAALLIAFLMTSTIDDDG